MDEKEFWSRLEFRLGSEFAGLPERRHQYFWCDGFLPYEYMLEGPLPKITGRCWIVEGQDQMNWEFTFILPRPFTTRDEVDWASLLPAEGMTRWMAFDESRQYIEIEPAVAVPDLANEQFP